MLGEIVPTYALSEFNALPEIGSVEAQQINALVLAACDRADAILDEASSQEPENCGGNS